MCKKNKILIKPTHIYFDWSETLAKPRKREIFMYGKTLKERLGVLYEDVLYTLYYLCKKGYTLGIISNTSKDKDEIMDSLTKTGLIYYFRGAIIMSSEKNMCKKPCSKIFQHALSIDGVNPSSAIMVGNNYNKDILGASKIGMNTIYVNRKNNVIDHKKSIQIKNISDLISYL